MFVVVGNQRTGTNLLREILNTNDAVAMLGEILSPSTAPAHWNNFLRDHPAGDAARMTAGELEALLDRYFEFVRYRIHYHWEHDRKSGSSALGVDIKYNQLRVIQPNGWPSAERPFLVNYLTSRGFTFVHTIRRNVLHCAISALLASQRGIWHNYDGRSIERAYHVDAETCLAYVRAVIAERAACSGWIEKSANVAAYYDELVCDVARAGPDGVIPERPGALRKLAGALGVPFDFRYDGQLQKAINVPYSRAIANFAELVRVVEASEFAAYAATLRD
jgi:LPS sulfotransferase NodH